MFSDAFPWLWGRVPRQELIKSIPRGSSEQEIIYSAGVWVQAVADRDTVYRRRAACALLGIFFDAGPRGHWWPNAVKQGPGGQRLPSLRDLPPFDTLDDSTIGILDVTVVDAASRGQLIGLLEVPTPTEKGFSFIIGGHSHCSFTDGNRFVAAAAASALAGCECRLVSGATADWKVREPEIYEKDGNRSAHAVVLSNTLLYDPVWDKTRAEKVPFVGVLALKTDGKDGTSEVLECYYRVLRSNRTLSRGMTDRVAYELGSDPLDPPPWRPRVGASGACDYSYILKPTDADDMEVDGDNGSRANVSERLVAGDQPPLVSGLDFSQLFTAPGDERRGMAALQPGDRIYVALHKTQAWPKGIAGPAAATPWEATHAVLAGSEPVETEGHTSSLAIPPALQEVPKPTAARPPVQRLDTSWRLRDTAGRAARRGGRGRPRALLPRRRPARSCASARAGQLQDDL